MGNPAIQGEGGACITCGHCQGFRTQPRSSPACLCDKTGDVRWWFGNVLTGCRYWLAQVENPSNAVSGSQ